MIDHSPVFSHTQRVVQGQHHAASTKLHGLRDHCECRGRDGWVRIQAAKRMEVPLRRPYRIEPMRVRKSGTLDEEPVGIALLRAARVGGKIEETEGHRGTGRHHGLAIFAAVFEDGGAVSVLLEYDLEATCKSPKQLQH